LVRLDKSVLAWTPQSWPCEKEKKEFELTATSENHKVTQKGKSDILYVSSFSKTALNVRYIRGS